MPASRLYRPVAALAIVVVAFLVGPGQVWAACCSVPTPASACCAAPAEADEARETAAIEGRCCCEVSSHGGPVQPRRAPAVAATAVAWVAAPPGTAVVEPPAAPVAVSGRPPVVTWTPQARIHLRNRVIQR